VNLSTSLNSWGFFDHGVLFVVIAAAIAYPFATDNARRAASCVVERVGHEAIIGTFAASSSSSASGRAASWGCSSP
jgi:putative tricarboxylic transport membrane protein